MALAEPAYSWDSLAAFPQEGPRSPEVRARRSSDAPATTSLLFTAAKMAAIVLVVVAVLAFARIALTSATVTTLIESDELSSQIQDARSTGVTLEMEQSVLSNPYAIKAAAKELGMTAPASVGVISLDRDVVAVDAGGELSLTDTIKNLAKAQG